jgi:N-acetylglucosamine-6-sulfatase
MPFVIRWPGVISPGTRSKALIQNIDYAPTFLELAGVDVPEEMQGRSLVPVFENGGQQPGDWRDAIYYAFYENASVHNAPRQDGVRTDRYKLIFFPRTREWNLFDLQKDPQEMTSLHDDPNYAEILRGLQQRCEDLRSFYGVNTAVIPATRGDEPGWKERDALLTKRAREGAGKVRLAFIGDSITHRWEGNGKNVWDSYYADRGAINLGIGGDRTEHVLWRLDNGEVDGLKPKAIMLMIGTNNLGTKQSPEDTILGVKAVVAKLREKLPDSKLLLLAVFPRGNQPGDPFRAQIKQVNDAIATLDDGKNIKYLDISEKFLAPSGELTKEIMPDFLHPNAKGYEIWADAVGPTLDEMLK